MYKKGYEKIKNREKRQIVDFFNFREILLFSRLKFPKISRGQISRIEGFQIFRVDKISRKWPKYAKIAKINPREI